MDKKNAAWELYKEGWTQKRIASCLSVSEQTICSWKDKDQWDKKMAKHKDLWENNEAKVAKLISYQLRALERKTKQWEEEGADKLIGKGEIDALSKLYSTIKKKDIAWGNYISCCKELIEYIQLEDLELAKMLTSIVDSFLNHKRLEL